MKPIRFTAVLCLMLAGAANAHAQTPFATSTLVAPVPDLAPVNAESRQAAPPAPPKSEVANPVTGLGLGVGLSFTWDTVDRERVTDAVIDANGIVRVNKKNNAIARIMLEGHYLFDFDEQSQGTRGWGPFVAVQPGSENVINALGVGFMVAFRYSSESERSFNLGIGYSVDPNSKVLGDEFVENAPAPLGPDGKPLAIRFQERDQGGFLALASFSWK